MQAVRTRDVCPALFCVRDAKPAGHSETQPSRPRPTAPTEMATPISPRSSRNTAKTSAAPPPRVRSRRAACLGSALENALPAQSSRMRMATPRINGMSSYVAACRTTSVAQLLQLLKQPDGARAVPPFEIGERFHAAGRIGRGRPQQVGEFAFRTGREAAISAVRKPGDFAESLLADWVVTLLEHERGDVAQPQLAGGGAQIVERFLHGVTDKDQHRNLLLVVLSSRV